MLTVGLLTTLVLTTGCPRTGPSRPAFPVLEAQKALDGMKQGCTPDGAGRWLCDHQTISEAAHALVDLKWDLQDAKDYNEYLEKKGALKVESLEAKLASCPHDPWCLGPSVAAAFLLVGGVVGILVAR